MIVLIHGENLVDSRRKLFSLKSGYQNIESISGKRLSALVLKKKLGEIGPGLFNERIALVIEEFNGDWEIIPKDITIDLILWSNTRLREIKAKVAEFRFDDFKAVSSFKFSDSVLYKKERQSQLFLKKLFDQNEPPEKIIGALTRGFAQLYATKEKNNLNLPPFAREKIVEQSKEWTKTQIKKAFLLLIAADLNLKSGGKGGRVLSSLVSYLTAL